MGRKSRKRRTVQQFRGEEMSEVVMRETRQAQATARRRDRTPGTANSHDVRYGLWLAFGVKAGK